MKKHIYLLFFFFIFFGCKNQNPEDRKIDYIANSDVVGEFDRVKYPLIQEGIELLIEKKSKESIEKLNIAENEYGKMIQICINRGVAFDQIGDYENAEKDFSECLKLDNTYLPALLNRGLVYTHSNRYKKAINDFNKAIEINPSEPASYLNRAVVYRKMNEFNLACIDLKTAKSLGIIEKYGNDMVLKIEDELDCK